MTNACLNFTENFTLSDITVNELTAHRNEVAARKMLESLLFRYAVVTKISITLRSEANANEYAKYRRAYRRAKDVNEQIAAICTVIQDILGWTTTISNEDIAFYKPAFDELFNPTNAENEYDADDVDSMVIEQNFKCSICGGDMTFDDAEGAHLFAQVFFGNRLGTRNVRAAHKKCNCRQGISFVDVKYRKDKQYAK